MKKSKSLSIKRTFFTFRGIFGFIFVMNLDGFDLKDIYSSKIDFLQFYLKHM